MKTLPLALLALSIGSVQAVPYMDIYDIAQGGYDGTGLPETITGTIKITDIDGDGLISANDPFSGVLHFRRTLSSGFYLRGFDVIGITGDSLLTGSFSITGLSHLGGLAVVINLGGTVENFDFPLNGQSVISSTTQAPVITKRVPDGGSTVFLLGMGLITLLHLKSRR